MLQVEFVDWDNVTAGKNIFMDPQQSGPPKINEAEGLLRINNFSNAIVLRRGAVIHQIPFLNMVIGSPVIWHNHW
jgi:hypothetical protein